MEEKKRGLFVVFEGIDRCGKSTQSQLLYDSIQDDGEVCSLSPFPNRFSLPGSMITSYLSADKKLYEPLHTRSLQLIFAADRWQGSDHIRDQLSHGVHVICDRYSYSGICYGKANGLESDFCYSLEEGLPEPDAVFYLSMDPKEAPKRNGYGKGIYDKEDFQQVVSKEYDEMAKKRPDIWFKIDTTNKTKEVIHKEIRRIFLDLKTKDHPRIPYVIEKANSGDEEKLAE